MKRSKSVSHQKAKKLIQCQTSNQPSKLNKKHIKIQNIQTRQDHPQTQRLNSSRHTFEGRLQKIRKGFQKLQMNLNMNSSVYDATGEKLGPMTSDLKPCKVAKKLFLSETSKKTVGKNKKKKKQLFGALNVSSKQKYHTCGYEKSVYDLMKIVIIQKEEIARLNQEVIKSSRAKK